MINSLDRFAAVDPAVSRKRMPLILPFSQLVKRRILPVQSRHHKKGGVGDLRLIKYAENAIDVLKRGRHDVMDRNKGIHDVQSDKRGGE